MNKKISTKLVVAIIIAVVLLAVAVLAYKSGLIEQLQKPIGPLPE